MKFLTISILVLIVFSCDHVSTDLSAFNSLKTESFKNLKLKRIEDQKGSWEFNSNFEPKLNKSSKLSKHYFFNYPEEINHLKFSTFTIDKELGVKVIEYDNKISFYKLSFKNDETFQVLNFLKQNLGNDFIPFKATLNMNKYNSSKVKILKSEQKDEIKIIDDEIEGKTMVFNDFYLWEKNNFIVFYRLGLTSDGFSNELIFITKKALKDQIVFGYHNISEDQYLKNIKL